MEGSATSTPLGERLRVHALRLAPLRLYSDVVRLVSRIPLPAVLRGPVFGSLGRALGMDLSEAEHDVGRYPSFQHLFVRRLADGSRPLQPGVVSPVDGCVSALGSVDDGRLIQAKGIDYTVEKLVGDAGVAREVSDGTFVTLYLRPRDYHRIHAPLAGRLVDIRHIHGAAFPVQPHVVRNLDGLFVRNERVVLKVEVDGGTMVVVCVAATGVSDISVAFGDTTPKSAATHLPLELERGQEVAAFNLGSTVILLFSPGLVRLAPLSPGQEIRMGETLAGSDTAPSAPNQS